MTQHLIITHTAASSRAGSQQSFPADAEVSIGRRPDNAVVFDPERDRAVSGNHARVSQADGVLTIEDLGSQNGTYVDGQRIDGACTLAPGAVVRLGQNGPEFSVSLGEAAPPMTLPDGSTAAVAHAAASTAAPGPAASGEGSVPKTTVGINTLQNAITKASLSERQKSRRSLMVTSMIILVMVGVAGGIWWWSEQEAKQTLIAQQAESERLVRESAARVEQVEAGLLALGQQVESEIKSSMARFDQELANISGQLSEGEGQVARLMVEIQQRDQALEEIRSRQDLTDAERARMLAATEERMTNLQEELRRSEESLREEVGRQSRWADLAEEYEQSIFLIVIQVQPIEGHAGFTSIGSSFVVREGGVLATNGHVVDPFFQAQARKQPVAAAVAIQNGTGRVFGIDRLFKHPQYQSPASPDLGLVTLRGATDLKPLPLADEATLRDLRIGTQLGTLGFPGEMMADYLRGVQNETSVAIGAMATFKDGWIGRITDFKLGRAPFESAYYIQHSAATTGGTSGSALFNADGVVVAVHNSGRSGQNTAFDGQIRFGIRVDLLTKWLTDLNL